MEISRASVTAEEKYCNTQHQLELILVDEEKNLRVITDKKLLSESHVQSKINKANQLVGIIRRSFKFLNTYTDVLFPP